MRIFNQPNALPGFWVVTLPDGITALEFRSPSRECTTEIQACKIKYKFYKQTRNLRKNKKKIEQNPWKHDELENTMVGWK